MVERACERHDLVDGSGLVAVRWWRGRFLTAGAMLDGLGEGNSCTITKIRPLEKNIDNISRNI